MNTFGSLFAGVGGFDMGFEQAGFQCLFQVEWDKHCQTVLNRHWPDVPKWGDVCDVNGTELPSVDVLIFGSPCQDLSVAGKRAGIDGGRSSMFFEATRIIKEMQNATGGTYPRVAVWENVPGALSSNKGADFQTVLNEMGDCGAHLLEWAVLDAQHFGVPQRRRRVFLVSVFDSAAAGRCPDPLFPVREGCRGDYQKGIKKGQTVAGTLTESIGSSQSTAVKTVRSGARDADGNLPPEVWQETDLAPTLNSMDNTGESRATILAFEEPIFFQMHQSGETRIQKDVMHTLAGYMGTGGNNTPMVTIPTVRRLTPLECERLMGWPDNHTRWRADGTEQSDSARYKQCGNGVATPVAKWVATQIKGTL